MQPVSVVDPGRFLRLTGSTLSVLTEMETTPLDDRARQRLFDMWTRFVAEIGSTMSAEATRELHSLVPDHTATPSVGELRVLHAQLVGWLAGVLHAEEHATLDAAVTEVRRWIEVGRHHEPERAPAPVGGPSPYL